LKAIYSFFENTDNRKHMFVDEREIEVLLSRTTDIEISSATMAMILESKGNNVKALEMWSKLKSEDSFRKVVKILAKSSISSAETIFKNIKRVLILNP